MSLFFQTIVIGNDVFLLENVQNRKYRRVTSDGIADVVFNGVPDWLYEGAFF